MLHRLPILLVIILALFAVQAAVLYAFGQPPICECGTVKLWEGTTARSSLDVSDWYSFSHIIHGFLFYTFLWYFFPRWTVLQRLVVAVGIEAAWEMSENLPAVIKHYRLQALAGEYTGDSILNSLFDTAAMMLGFLFAARAPLTATIFVALGLELLAGYTIRDNLTLNILGFFYQSEFIKEWQLSR